MTDNVLRLVPETVGADYKFEPDTILEEAKGQLTEVVVIGMDKDGDIYISASHNSGSANMLLDCGKAEIIRRATGEE